MSQSIHEFDPRKAPSINLPDYCRMILLLILLSITVAICYWIFKANSASNSDERFVKEDSLPTLPSSFRECWSGETQRVAEHLMAIEMILIGIGDALTAALNKLQRMLASIYRQASDGFVASGLDVIGTSIR